MKYLLGASDLETSARIKNEILESLQELSDLSWQRRVWFLGDGPEQSSFTETVERLFGDTTLGQSLDSGEVVFGDAVDQQLRRLRVALTPYYRLPPDLKVLDTRAWLEVAELSSAIHDLILLS